jgi:hypothetical protein
MSDDVVSVVGITRHLTVVDKVDVPSQFINYHFAGADGVILERITSCWSHIRLPFVLLRYLTFCGCSDDVVSVVDHNKAPESRCRQGRCSVTVGNYRYNWS